MKKLLMIICLISSFTLLFTNNSFAQVTADKKAEAEKAYRELLGLTGKPEDVKPNLTWIADQMLHGKDKFEGRIWNKEKKYYELKIGTRLLRLYTLDKKQVEKISVIQPQENIYIGQAGVTKTEFEYREIIGDLNGNVIEGAFAPSIAGLKTVKKTFTPDKKELKLWWQYELESEMRNLRAALNTHKE
jgi:hypothetical protein